MGKGESPFVMPTAVEAWDTWFRWRENGVLRDETVDATWQRVASALAAVEPYAERHAFEDRLFGAFINWRLLLDERILATAGTGAAAWPDDELVAVLNVASFVRSPATPRASIDFAAMKDCAELAVHALDNAIALRNDSKRIAKRLRIGIIGFADALVLLGLEYASAEAQVLARRIATALAEGSLRATIALAETRGYTMRCDESWPQRAQLRSTPPDLIERAIRYGLRHVGLTSITSQPRLARFANDVTDAIHPLAADRTYAARAHSGSWAPTQTSASVLSQLNVRSAMQPWIDEPIPCPAQSAEQPTLAAHLD